MSDAIPIRRRVGEEFEVAGVRVRIAAASDGEVRLEIVGGQGEEQIETGGRRAKPHKVGKPTQASVDLTVREPDPEILLDPGRAMRIACGAASSWIHTIALAVIVIRTVATDARLRPVGRASTGRWTYEVSGYCRTVLNRLWWKADVDARTGRILGIHEVEWDY
jgi:hypothetical protein